ncbi:MAG: hypothetical protein KDD63_17645, partial [Bacteroidetes bacterium]|nr:hypothetical protein [Bacteroidota bacterium]
MKNYTLFAFLLLFFGCKEKLPPVKNFPIIMTQQPTDINETGATFQAEIVRAGNYPTQEYGFLWDIKEPDINSSHKLILGTDINEGIIHVRIDSQLVKGFDYIVRAYGALSGKVVYGNPVSFTSLGDNYSPWGMEVSPHPFKIRGFGVSDGKKGHVFSCGQGTGSYYIFDPVTLFSEPSLHPVSQFGCYLSAYAKIDETLYLLSGGRPTPFYKYQNEAWSSVKSKVPFYTYNFDGFFLGFPFDNKFYVIASPNTYLYDIAADTWELKASFPGNEGIPIGGTYLGDKVYMATSTKKILIYDPVTDQWSFFSEYPGELRDFEEGGLTGFSDDKTNTLYFGKIGVETEIYAYELDNTRWSVNSFSPPQNFTGRVFYSFLHAGKLYF